MPTLHDTTDLTKKIGLWAGAGVIILIILLFTLRTGKAIKNYFFPPGPPPPTVSFGKLKEVPFPENVTKEKLEYTLDTISGVLPTFPTQLKVYKILHNEPSLLGFQRIRMTVGNVGFTGQENKAADDTYIWTDTQQLTRSIKINTISQNFTVDSIFTTSDAVLNGSNLPYESEAVDISKSFLENMQLLPEDIDISKTTTELYTLQSGILLPATSLSAAKIIRVDFHQKDLEDIPMYYPNPPHSTIYFLIAGNAPSGDAKSIVQAKFYHQMIDPKGETYPVKSVDQAFAELKNGKGYIASFFGSNRNIKITDITLGYYLSDQDQDFLMPVIVFHGDSDFYAYVPAVRSDWITK